MTAQDAAQGHRAATERHRARLRSMPGWMLRWDGLWIAHKIDAHEARAAERPMSVLSSFSLGVWTIERSDAHPREKAQQRRALAVRLGLPEDV